MESERRPNDSGLEALLVTLSRLSPPGVSAELVRACYQIEWESRNDTNRKAVDSLAARIKMQVREESANRHED